MVRQCNMSFRDQDLNKEKLLIFFKDQEFEKTTKNDIPPDYLFA